jgi:hypothetical protein
MPCLTAPVPFGLVQAVAYLVRRGVRSGRTATYFGGVLLAVAAFVALVADITGGPLTTVVAGAVVHHDTTRAREFFGQRYRTTEDDTRLWTLRSRGKAS